MINDGYNKTIELKLGGKPVWFEYRPALRWERLLLFGRISHLGDPTQAKRLLDDEIDKRILYCNGITRELRGAVLRAVLGQQPKSTEFEDAENLVEGIRLLLKFPKMEGVTCDLCKKFWMDPRKNEYTIRRGEKVLRPDYAKRLCEIPDGEGCPKGSPENEKGLSPKNKRALNHYLECRATGQFPDDPIVRRNARLIARELKNARLAVFTV